MADLIHIDVTGTRQVGLRFETFPDDLYEDFRKEVDALTRELFALVVAATPSLTGRLRSQERVRLFADKDRITGYIDIDGEGSGGSSDFAKAASLEYGAHGEANVKSYTRGEDSRSLLDKLFGAPHDNIVRAYSRTVNIAERRFERGPLEAMQPEIISRLNAVVEKRAAQANA